MSINTCGKGGKANAQVSIITGTERYKLGLEIKRELLIIKTNWLRKKCLS